ncbi:MAG TPA: DsbA family protein [Caulobacteraceae bacterium]|nr:DsbA family protein [Caulobacteraceae bacterium]
MPDRRLIYFADPMCSWCYGFAPVIAAIRAEFGDALAIQLVMGGLRPGTTDPMTPKARENILEHWTHVHEATGQPFDASILADGFVYDTDPGARAVVLMRGHDPNLAIDYLERAQTAFYAEARDVTKPEVLGQLAAEFGFDPGPFAEAVASNEDLKMTTWRDYAVSQRSGVSGFPTLVGGPDGEGRYGAITRGYASAEDVLDVLRRWVAAPAA